VGLGRNVDCHRGSGGSEERKKRGFSARARARAMNERAREHATSAPGVEEASRLVPVIRRMTFAGAELFTGVHPREIKIEAPVLDERSRGSVPSASAARKEDRSTHVDGIIFRQSNDRRSRVTCDSRNIRGTYRGRGEGGGGAGSLIIFEKQLSLFHRDADARRKKRQLYRRQCIAGGARQR